MGSAEAILKCRQCQTTLSAEKPRLIIFLPSLVKIPKKAQISMGQKLAGVKCEPPFSYRFQIVTFVIVNFILRDLWTIILIKCIKFKQASVVNCASIIAQEEVNWKHIFRHISLAFLTKYF